MAKASKPDNSRYAERLLAQRKAVAAEFGIEDASDWRVRRLALLQALFASAEDQIADGRQVDITKVMDLDRAIQELRTSLRANEPIDIQIHVVKGITGICPKCQARIEDYKAPEPLPPPPALSAPAPFLRPIDEAEKPAAAEPAVKPAPHTNGSVSAFHNQAGVPLKRLQASPYRVRKVSPLGG
jgi:hypothetical protein